jgi:magnesium transporter
MPSKQKPKAIPNLPRGLNPIHRLRVVGRFVRREMKKPGSAPGTLVHTGVKKVERSRITFIDFDPTTLDEREVRDVSEVLPLRDSPTVSWINVWGLHEVDLIQKIGDHFHLHPLLMEDILHVGQRPKLDGYEDCLYMVLTMLGWNEEHRLVEEEQLSVVLGRGWVLTFQERVGDAFDPVRERIRTSNRRIRARGADYLAYALVDAVVDRYFSILERLGELTEELELAVMQGSGPEAMANLHHLKRELLVIRRAVSPVRDLVAGFLRDESGLIEAETRIFMRDVQDHASRIGESVDSLRDVASGLMDLHLSTLGQRTNEVMKVLTIMASVFIPLTFMAGIYGMNFEYMPELDLPWAYPALWVAMLAVAGAMLAYFKRKDWL